MFALSFLEGNRDAFVAHLADRLSAAICAQTSAMFGARGISAPARSASVLLYLLHRGPATLAEIARHDGQSHQLLLTKLAPLEEAGFVKRSVDPKDARRRPYTLTRRGSGEAKLVDAACTEIASAMTSVFKDIGVDLVRALDDAINAIQVSPLEARAHVRTRRR